MQSSWDIFCRVVDNYGDIGVCWRLARQLAAEHDIAVQLWVDDLASFARLCPAIDVSQDSQRVLGINVRRWAEPFTDAVPRDVVIEAFGCELPAAFKSAMSAKARAPAWINLEYLSAEPWVMGTHARPSPHGSLTKYFFFPGFVAGAGGLLREQGLMAQRERFQRDPTALAEFWRSLELETPRDDELRVSLFCYDNPALDELLRQWAAASSPITCLAPAGIAMSALTKFFGEPSTSVNRTYAAGNLTVRIIPFLEHEHYDRLLWACAINFIRGEDSFVRAQWAARPFVWHIYPQKDDAHRVKLDAFLDLFCADMEAASARQMRSFFHGWNGDGLGPAAWRELLKTRAMVENHVDHWSRKLARQPDLAANLVNFSRNLLNLWVDT